MELPEERKETGASSGFSHIAVEKGFLLAGSFGKSFRKNS